MGIFLTSIFCFFMGVAAQCAVLMAYDLVMSVIYFVFTAEWVSTLSLGVVFLEEQMDFRFSEYWKVSTGLPGIDFLINGFVSLQYEYSGRWIMMIISSVIFASLLLIVGFLTDWDNDLMGESDSMPANIGWISSAFILLPISFGGYIGGASMILMQIFGS